MWTMKTLSLQRLHYLGLKLTRIYPRGFYIPSQKSNGIQIQPDIHYWVSYVGGGEGRCLLVEVTWIPWTPSWRPGHRNHPEGSFKQELMRPTPNISNSVSDSTWCLRFCIADEFPSDATVVRGTTFSELLVYPPKTLGMASLLYLVLVLVLTPVFASSCFPKPSQPWFTVLAIAPS